MKFFLIDINALVLHYCRGSHSISPRCFIRSGKGNRYENISLFKHVRFNSSGLTRAHAEVLSLCVVCKLIMKDYTMHPIK